MVNFGLEGTIVRIFFVTDDDMDAFCHSLQYLTKKTWIFKQFSLLWNYCTHWRRRLRRLIDGNYLLEFWNGFSEFYVCAAREFHERYVYCVNYAFQIIPWSHGSWINFPNQNSHLAYSRIKFQRNVSWTGCLRINPNGYEKEPRSICPMGRLCCSTTSEWSSGTSLYDNERSLANVESLRPFVLAPVFTAACAALHSSLRRKLLIPKW